MSRDPFVAENRGLAFTLEERRARGLEGILPSAVDSPEAQVSRVMARINTMTTKLDQYIFLQSLQDTHESLYYRVLMTHTEALMPIVYTPTVAQACLEFSHIYRQSLVPRGLYLSLGHLGRVRTILDNWPESQVKCIVVTDGERILSLGDLGVHGMGISIGKMALYTVCAGVHPRHCLPVTLDCGTNNTTLLEDPHYIGLRQTRESGPVYAQLVDEFMCAVKDKYGPDCLVQFEDFGNANAYRFMNQYRGHYCTFNDDIQGTASVIIAGLIAASSLCKTQHLAQHKYLFLGAGEASLGMADLLVLAMIREQPSMTLDQARERIVLIDSSSSSLTISDCHHHYHVLPGKCGTTSLEHIVSKVGPSVLMGIPGGCAQPHAFTKEVCEAMARLNPVPIIMALSNPNTAAECTAEEAYLWTSGTCVFASGSPFSPVTLPDGRVLSPGQGNNAYVFPGIGLGVLAAGCTRVTDEMLLLAAETLAKHVSRENLARGCVFPPLTELQPVSLEIALAIAEYGYTQGLATKPRAKDIKTYIASIMYTAS